METLLCSILLVISVRLAEAKDEDLPLCPTNFQYFPQNLPMHCRMPTGADISSYPGMPSFPAPPASSDKQSISVPAPMPMPGAMPMPGPMSMPMAGPIPMMPMPAPGPSQKLPVIVMPFYSPDTSFKKPGRPKPPPPSWKPPQRPYDTETSSDTDTSSDDSDTDSSSENGWWKGKKRGWRKNGRRSNRAHSRSHHKKRHYKKKKDLLTPVLQYVTNDGYVIYEKQISKGEAKDWLRVNNDGQKPGIEHDEGKNAQDVDASVHEEINEEVEETKKEDREEIEKAIEKEETTTKGHPRRHHHRKGISPVINKLMPSKR